MLTLHESLLLFALHDDRGTIHSRAWLGLDDGLRGAVIAEWHLRGHLALRRGGLGSWTGRRKNGTPLLDGLRRLLEGSISTPTFVMDALFAGLEVHAPDLKERVERSLVARGIAFRGAIERHELEAGSTLHGATEEERAMLERVRAAIRQVERAPRRDGVLVGLVDALDLWPVLLPEASAERLEEARQAGAWVRRRDPICAEVMERVFERMGMEGP